MKQNNSYNTSNTVNSFDKIFDAVKKSPNFWAELVLIEFTEELLRLNGGNKTAYNDPAKLTLKEMSNEAFELGKKLEIRFVDIDKAQK